MSEISQNNPKKFTVFPPTLKSRIAVLFVAFFIMLWITGMCGFLYSLVGLGERTQFLAVSATQSLFAFIFPAWLAARLCSPDGSRYLGLRSPAGIKPYLYILVMFIAATPLLNFIIDWNAGLHLPDSMSGMEAQLRKMEDAAAAMTETILGDKSVYGLISGILIVGCLTGFAEEMFFRAGIQKALVSSRVNPHLAIWLTALIFSAVHFQFFGFVPRLLLGAFFGYMYYYTGSLWVAAAAHAFNNSMVVFSSWMVANGWWSVEIEKLGLPGTGFPWLLTASALLTFLLLTRLPKESEVKLTL